MAYRVSLARKNLLQDRRRTVLTVLGVAASLLLVLVLDGVFAGAMRQVTAYLRSSPAEIFVSQQDVRTMHMSESALPPDAVEAVRASDGVAWAEALYFTTGIIDVGDETRLSYVFGYDVATGRGGPRQITAGAAPRPGEALVDDVVADEVGIEVGDTVAVLGAPFRVSGLSTDGTNMANTTAFITDGDFVRLRGPSVSFVLIGTDAGFRTDDVTRSIADALPAATVQTRAEFVAQERRIVQDMAADVMQIMTVIGFLIALAVVGLALFTATLAKLREYGVVKALGASAPRLTTTVVAHAAWTVLIGLALAVAAALVLGAAVTALTPNVRVVIETGAIARTAAGALLVGGLGAIVPLRRVLRLDPATAFRRP